jgi:spore maturation protein SpmA
MAMNIIWMAFFVIAFIIALVKSVFFGDTEIFKLLSDGMFDAAKFWM